MLAKWDGIALPLHRRCGFRRTSAAVYLVSAGPYNSDEPVCGLLQGLEEVNHISAAA